MLIVVIHRAPETEFSFHRALGVKATAINAKSFYLKTGRPSRLSSDSLAEEEQVHLREAFHSCGKMPWHCEFFGFHQSVLKA
jgi:hypothetical protein